MLWRDVESGDDNSDNTSDPLTRGYQVFFRKVRNVLFTLLFLAMALLILGVPSIQGDYSYRQGAGEYPTALDKYEAIYWNPIAGCKKVQANQYGRGCPVFIFMPLRDCVELQRYRNNTTEMIFGKEFFDGP